MHHDLPTWLKGRICSAPLSATHERTRQWTNWWPLRSRGGIWEVWFELRDGHPGCAQTGAIDLISLGNLQALSGSPRPAAVIPPDPRRYAPTHSLGMWTILVAFRQDCFWSGRNSQPCACSSPGVHIPDWAPHKEDRTGGRLYDPLLH